MFTGIIESLGTIKEISTEGSNKSFWIESPISHELKPDQSVSHNGVCLTVEEVRKHVHRISAVKETLKKSNLKNWKIGDQINLERSLRMNGMIDGHLVQGHVDIAVQCLRKKEKNGSWEFQFELPKKFAELVIEKGSVCINGISLTAFDVKKKSFRVAIIPFTNEQTNMKQLKETDYVNIEFDLVGKYILRKLSLGNH